MFAFALLIPRNDDFNKITVTFLMILYTGYHSIVSPTLVGSIPRVVKMKDLGQAYGLFGVFTCLGIILGSFVFGFVKDYTENTSVNGYDYIIAFFGLL